MQTVSFIIPGGGLVPGSRRERYRPVGTGPVCNKGGSRDGDPDEVGGSWRHSAGFQRYTSVQKASQRAVDESHLRFRQSLLASQTLLGRATARYQDTGAELDHVPWLDLPPQ